MMIVRYYHCEQISGVGIGGMYSTFGADKGVYNILFGKAKVKRLVTRKGPMWIMLLMWKLRTAIVSSEYGNGRQYPYIHGRRGVF
jgi:hypothetical protein